jgi:hypothetical protein
MAYRRWIAAGAVLCACGAQSPNRTAIDDDGGSTSDSGADAGVAPGDAASTDADTAASARDTGAASAEAAADVASDATDASDAGESLSIGPAPFTPFQGIAYSGTVAVWRAGPSGSFSYQMSVDWGDGTAPSTGGPFSYMTHPFVVSAPHTYAKSGTATVSVTVVDTATGASAHTSYPIRIGILLSGITDDVQAVAVDSTDVYWATGNPVKVAKTPIGGGTATTLFTGQGAVSNGGLAVYGGYLYASASGAILKCAVGGCNNQPTTLAPVPFGPTSVAVDSQNIYWPDYYARANGVIFACALGGCGNNPSTFASGQAFPTSIASDSKNVFWTNGGIGTDGGSVMTCPVSGCAPPTPVASGQSVPSSLAIDANSVYWADTHVGGGGSIQKCPLSGCGAGPVVLASGDPTFVVNGLAIDSTYVYWGARGVSRVPLGGGTPEALTDDYEGSASVQAVDDANVYYTRYTASALAQLVQLAK